ncbi:MAG TPA: DinB family protein [Fontimonas sp.]
MINCCYVEKMAAYNAWMNAKIYAACAQLTDAERKRDVGAFFKSIHGTLNHLLLADRVWLARFNNRRFGATSLAQELYADFAALSEARRQTDDELAAWAAGLTDEQLGGVFSYTPITDPTPRTAPLALSLMHLFNHQTHHRGQVTTLLMQAGIDPGATDLIAMPNPASA